MSPQLAAPLRVYLPSYDPVFCLVPKRLVVPNIGLTGDSRYLVSFHLESSLGISGAYDYGYVVPN